jgi:hypothetical protein
VAATVYASGTQTATVGTEHFVSSPNVAGVFVFTVELTAMLAGDILELRAYKMTVTGGSSDVYAFAQIAGARPTDDQVWTCVPLSNALTDTNALRFSIKQVGGTSRTFPWEVLRHS